MKTWKDQEVKALFFEVEKCKGENKSLRLAFEQHAVNFKRKPNSVRNYYYHEVDNLAGDQKRAQKLGINLSLHTKLHFQSFDEKSEKELVEKIEQMTKSGMSVRSACLKLSGGDLSLMTRLQNKYQNIKRKDNIIPFKARKYLTDADINSLFMGLVKLIKKTAQEEGNSVLRNAFSQLEQKQQEIEKLKKQLLEQKLQTNKTEKLKQHLTNNQNKGGEKTKRV